MESALGIAEQDSGKIGHNVQFPLEEKPELFRGRRNTYLEGIRDERIATFQKFQPYNAGNWLSDLRRLSNFYKHTGLILVEKKISQIKPLAPAHQAQYRGRDGRLSRESL
jgi:hypothetical protein